MGTDVQAEFDLAVSNYLSLANALTEDLVQLQESETESASWRRNYIRVVAATIEGYSHCFRAMANVGLRLDSSPYSRREVEAMSSGFGLTTSDRIKLTLRVVYRMFEIDEQPDFGGVEWHNALLVFDKRHDLMHPKTAEDLAVGDDAWDSLWSGATWLVTQHFKFMEKLYVMHVQSDR